MLCSFLQLIYLHLCCVQVVYHLRHGEVQEAYDLIQDLEPSIPQEYILKVRTLAEKFLGLLDTRLLGCTRASSMLKSAKPRTAESTLNSPSSTFSW